MTLCKIHVKGQSLGVQDQDLGLKVFVFQLHAITISQCVTQMSKTKRSPCYLFYHLFFEVPLVVVICLHCFDLSSERGKMKCHQLGHHFFLGEHVHMSTPHCCFLLFMNFFVIVTMFVVVINFCKQFLSIIFFCLQGMARKCHHHAPS